MENMDKNKRDNSSDFESSDDDMYTNAVARLKALEKKKKLQKKNIEEASFISLDLSMPIEIPDTDEIEEVKEQDAEPVMCDKRIESEAIPEVDASSSFDSSNESIDKGMQSPDVHEGKSASQTHFIATIVLDPDENEESMADVSINSISESDNYSIELKVLWRSHKVFRVDMRMYEPFQKAFDYFANLENVSTEQVLLLRNDKPVKPTDTPASLGISVIDIIGGVMDTKYVDDRSRAANVSDQDICQIKVQHSQKEAIVVSLRKTHPFKIAILQCATQLNVPDFKLKLYFDGDLISPSDTPESLDLEEQACIDLKIMP
ncbi:uncharacterized protein CG4449 isoform X3 [Belonocnema kinseyi]|uniref:uncharacterized protein CG4449 isoform X3 n=1 Tax=Belonocnema kinseyi TaxID=2817044 RepID=UPI00143D8FFC|nr:uncharacterized protein CG4449 isoform X3 [Belonocnema kinseyi]